jgi:hypothetical protein
MGLFDIGSVIEAGAELLGRFIPDKNEAMRLSHEIATMGQKQGHESAMAQIEVNKVEAASNSLFVAGWRPFVGWTCGGALFNNFILIPYMALFTAKIVPLDLTVMLPILIGMLGLAGTRTFEKVKGVAREK